MLYSDKILLWVKVKHIQNYWKPKIFGSFKSKIKVLNTVPLPSNGKQLQ